MHSPRSAIRTFLPPTLVAAQALVLIACEPVQPLLVERPRFSPSATGSFALAETQTRSVILTATDSSLTTGQVVQATASPRDYYGSRLIGFPVTWSITPTSVATISSTGVITAGQVSGTAVVTATVEGVSQSLTISVAGRATAASIVVTSANSSIKVGQSTQVVAVVKDANGVVIPGAQITWAAAPATIATITSTGLLTGHGVGTATIAASVDRITRGITLSVLDSAGSGTTGTTTPTTPTTPPGVIPAGATGATYGSATKAELPRVNVSTAYPAPIRQVRIPAGASLQAAINAALPGDELLLAPGATYSGNFTLPNKGSSSSWIVIRTDLPDATIGAAGTRMTPSRAANARLAKIVTPNGMSVITTALSAHHYRFTGVEIGATTTATDVNALVRFGDAGSAQNSIASMAHSLIIDRSLVRGTPTLHLRRCLLLNSGTAAVVDSWLAECHSNVSESQAIVGWNGSGPYLIQNNHLEGGHEVILFGGSGTTVPNVSPSDITIRGNHIMRPLAWKGIWQAKNLVETKHARRMLVEGNVIENTWADAQAGYAFVMKSENQNWDTPWTQSTDITIRYNRIRNVGGGFNIAANPTGAVAVPAARLVITDNVLENVNTGAFNGEGRSFQLLGGLADIVLMHNTVVSANGGSSMAVSFGETPVVQRLAMHSNILHHGAYGVKGPGASAGTGTLNTFAPGALFSNNAISNGGSMASYPAANYFPASTSILGLVDILSGDYRLSPTSSYVGRGYDGRDIGADMAQVTAATRNAVVAP